MIVIIDFGSQTAHLIGRRIRDFGIEVKLVDPENIIATIRVLKPEGIIFSGGPASVYDKNAPSIDPRIYDLKIPILGICYGMQLTGQILHGEVRMGKVKEYGPAILHLEGNSPLLAGITAKPIQVWMSHGDKVVRAPPEFTVFGSTDDVEIAAMENPQKKIYCIQFHPEVEHSNYGKLMLRNFVENICRLKLTRLTISVSMIINSLKINIGQDRCLCAVSGGVDSTVSAALVAKAVGKQLVPVYIESGLMRTGTQEEVEKLFRQHFGIKPVIVHAEKEFLAVLRGVTDPEIKRKNIGRLYIELFQKIAHKQKGPEVLVQGTIFSDVIESKGSIHADKIKSHHNVGGLPQELGFRLVEPLRNFYKDEVRKIAKLLKLPSEFIQKQVFPGPGFAIRIVGEVTQKRLDQIKLADDIVLDEMRSAGWLKKVYMSFPIMTNTDSTAVKGDGRFYGEVVALRIIQSTDVMTTNWVRLPFDLLQKMSSRIVNEVPDVSRVVYDITSKPPATMEWE